MVVYLAARERLTAQDGYFAYMHSQASKDGHVNRNTAERMDLYVSAASRGAAPSGMITPTDGLGVDTENSSNKNGISARIDRAQKIREYYFCTHEGC
jgi:hypothetical protein